MAHANHVENVADVEATPKIAVDEPLNAISFLPPSKWIPHSVAGSTKDSSMLGN